VVSATGAKYKLHPDIAGVLKSAKALKPNLTKQERTAIKELQQEKATIILPADRGRATVVMERKENQEKCE